MTDPTGAEAVVRLRVGEQDTAITAGSGDVAVLATPRVVALAEEAAVAAVASHLEPGETTVGTRVEMDHLAPSPVGSTVRAAARVTAVAGRRVEFGFEVSEGGKVVARGRHLRVVVDRDAFVAAAQGS